MKHMARLITLSLAALLIIGGVVLGCSSPSAPQTPSSTTQAAPPAPTAFKTSSLTVNPTEANSGIQVIVTAKVTNTSTTDFTYTPKLRIDNITRASLPTYLYLRDVDIRGGATQQMSFAVTADNPGKYKITWDDLAGEFVVVDNPAQPASSGNATAPDFTGVDVVTGKKISLSQFKGALVLFNFVNYGCDPSVNNIVSKQLLAIRDLQKQRSDFVPVSIFCGCCPAEVLRDFAKQNNLSWPWILDSDNSVARKYMTYIRKYGYPTLVFIDHDQRVRDFAGYTDVKGLSAKLDSILGKGTTY